MSDNMEVNYFVYIHFDFDDWQPDRLEDLRKDDMKGIFRGYRMVPQGRFHYFFSYNDECFIDHGKVRSKIDIFT